MTKSKKNGTIFTFTGSEPKFVDFVKTTDMGEGGVKKQKQLCCRLFVQCLIRNPKCVFKT